MECGMDDATRGERFDEGGRRRCVHVTGDEGWTLHGSVSLTSQCETARIPAKSRIKANEHLGFGA
jgi:hypothetical protein